MTDFATWFSAVTGRSPRPWQAELGADAAFRSRLVRIPTGFGKTHGVLLSWLYHRVVRGDDAWPRRLVWCLPMRVLVDQTFHEVDGILRGQGLLWLEDQKEKHDGKVGVHLLMGGADAGEWHLYPAHCAVLIGTQDMLLSRALNRGYGAARARWPTDFGLLHQDALWVLDEVQLMDVGLATSAQLAAFRSASPSARPCGSYWMSATLRPSWLESRDTKELVEALKPSTSIAPDKRSGPLWERVKKPCTLARDLAKPGVLAKRAMERHVALGAGAEGPTVVVVNTVDRALEVAKALGELVKKRKTEVRLVHSRFRPAEREGFREAFLNRAACEAGADRIVVATQVIEAGVDISARCLFTELAPWPSLVQRFGRAARWASDDRDVVAEIVVVDTAPKDDGAAAPYTLAEIDAARWAVEQLADVSPASLERFEEERAAELAALYRYEPAALLLREEVDELFDTTPDLTGSDLDVSRFIRSGEERDVHVFWGEIPARDRPSPKIRPARRALCAVPFLKAREWLFEKGHKPTRPRSAWVWSYLDGHWRIAEARDVYPGQTILVDAKIGGYRPDIGWSPKAHGPVVIVEPPESVPPSEVADAAQDQEELSATAGYRTIGTHGAETAGLATAYAETLLPAHRAPPEQGAPWSKLLALAGKLHDWGKAHPAFANSIKSDAPARPQGRRDLAKAPKGAWRPLGSLYPMDDGRQRRGFRHELASALALFAVLARHRPDHDALLGPWRELLSQLGEEAPEAVGGAVAPTALEREVIDLSRDDFDLVAYLVASHHGKVRASLHATPADQATTLETTRPTVRGVQAKDTLAPVRFGAGPGEVLPSFELDLGPSNLGVSPRTGESWADRVDKLLRRHGCFQLAWLEALLRAADAHASRIAGPDPLLTEAP